MKIMTTRQPAVSGRRNLSFAAALLMVLALLLAYTPNSNATAAESFKFEEITVKKLQEGYAKGEYTTVEVVQAYLDRIQRYEPNYNAFTTMNAKALDEAREIDRKRAAGEPLGPLAGVPIVIKEAVDMAGFPSTMGWAPLSPEKYRRDTFRL
jgi:amidase/aspartyl-tRNA(Asn)/glutamyl-tRNA(Gln) amidotransferase subunit A